MDPEKAITDFYFTIGEKHYGVGTGTVVGSGNTSETDITITVPYETPVTSMTASASHGGASIDPNPATPHNYTDPVTYRVTAADGTCQDYTVTVNVAKIASVTGINGNFLSPGFKKTDSNISGSIKAAITSVTGTDSLGTVITLAAADYSVDAFTPSVAGTTVDATLRVPVGKTSTRADIPKDFTVYIKNDAKAITAFSFPGLIGATSNIHGTAITVSVPYGTVLTSMTASAGLSANASISPDPGTPHNYTDPVTYRVTAADETYQDYTVTVNVAKITSVTKINGNLLSPDGFVKTDQNISGSIKDAITVTGTDSLGTVITLVAADYSVDAFTPSVAGTTVDATLRVSADRTSTRVDITKDFTVYIKNDARAITSFAIHSPVSAAGTINNMAITVSVPYGTVLTSMTASAGLSANASISPDPATPHNYTGPVTYMVTAEDGSTATYTVTVTGRPGITISGSITVEGFTALTFSSAPSSPVNANSPITIEISGGTVSNWYIDINDSVTPTGFDGTTVTFNAPSRAGFYNVNVIATVNDVDYSGSFGIIVK
jgi:hypothetical protein